MIRTGALCLFLFLYACTDNNKVPSDIIQKNEMQKLLWDMLQADRFAGVYIVPKFDSIKRDSAVFSLYDKVFQIHKITKDEFLKSYKFYLGRPDIMKTMFDSISAGAERRRADVYKRKIPDSLRKKVL